MTMLNNAEARAPHGLTLGGSVSHAIATKTPETDAKRERHHWLDINTKDVSRAARSSCEFLSISLTLLPFPPFYPQKAIITTMSLLP